MRESPMLPPVIRRSRLPVQQTSRAIRLNTPSYSRRLRNYPRRPRRSYRKKHSWFDLMPIVLLFLAFCGILSLLILSILQGQEPNLLRFSASFLYPGEVVVLLIIIIACIFLWRNRNSSLSMMPRRIDFDDDSDVLPFEDDSEELPWDDVYPLAWPASPTQRIEKIVAEKKQKFLNIPNISFQFANHEQIRDFYNAYFKEPMIESAVSEVSGEYSGNIKGGVSQFIEAQMQGINTNKWTSNLKIPILSSNEMFLRYQRETIRREQVSRAVCQVLCKIAGSGCSFGAAGIVSLLNLRLRMTA
jgi:hypothetical protein